jgi:hypothetical protein
MKDIYEEMIAVSRDIAASFPQPRFYVSCQEPLNLSNWPFDEDAQVMKCRTFILSELKNDFGHGIDPVSPTSSFCQGKKTRIQTETPLWRNFCSAQDIR